MSDDYDPDRYREVKPVDDGGDEWDSRPAALVVYMLVSVVLLVTVVGACLAWSGKGAP